jgi:hypothetical protein
MPTRSVFLAPPGLVCPAHPAKHISAKSKADILTILLIFITFRFILVFELKYGFRNPPTIIRYPTTKVFLLQ